MKAVFVTCLLCMAACFKPAGDRYVIPENCRGWVRVDFGRADAGVLPRENGFRIISIPKSGLVSTSEQLDERTNARHEYTDRSGRTIAVGGGMTVGEAKSCSNGFCSGELSDIRFLGGRNREGESIDTNGDPVIGLRCDVAPGAH